MVLHVLQREQSRGQPRLDRARRRAGRRFQRHGQRAGLGFDRRVGPGRCLVEHGQPRDGNRRTSLARQPGHELWLDRTGQRKRGTDGEAARRPNRRHLRRDAAHGSTIRYNTVPWTWTGGAGNAEWSSSGNWSAGSGSLSDNISVVLGGSAESGGTVDLLSTSADVSQLTFASSSAGHANEHGARAAASLTLDNGSSTIAIAIRAAATRSTPASPSASIAMPSSRRRPAAIRSLSPAISATAYAPRMASKKTALERWCFPAATPSLAVPSSTMARWLWIPAPPLWTART